MIGIVTGLTAEARIAQALGVARAGGGTSAGAAQAARALVAEGATALISFGVAGGLNPALAPGTLIVPPNVTTDAAIYATDPDLTARLGGPAYSLHATPDIAVTAWNKAALYKTSGADAVDMESGAVAEVAAAHGIKFAALRALCDPATRDLPPAALIALNAAGEISPLSVAASILRQPGQIPALLRLARDAAAARAALVARVEVLRSQGW